MEGEGYHAGGMTAQEKFPSPYIFVNTKMDWSPAPIVDPLVCDVICDLIDLTDYPLVILLILLSIHYILEMEWFRRMRCSKLIWHLTTVHPPFIDGIAGINTYIYTRSILYNYIVIQKHTYRYWIRALWPAPENQLPAAASSSRRHEPRTAPRIDGGRLRSAHAPRRWRYHRIHTLS